MRNTLPHKEIYTLRELLNSLPISRRELGRRSSVNKVTLDRLAHGVGIPLRSTINRVLGVMSEVYERPLNWENVTGIPHEQEKETPASIKERGFLV